MSEPIDFDPFESVKSMFCCNSNRFKFYKNDAEKKDSVRRNKMIDEEIEQDKMILKKQLKILLLGIYINILIYFIFNTQGGPESGKSTIFKQMRWEILKKSK